MHATHQIFKNIYIFLSSIGIEIFKLVNFVFIFKYCKQLWTFKTQGGVIDSIFPILSDYYQQAGNLPRDYFLQDLHVASMIFESSPKRHLDVGSRLDGFIAHVASFRKIEVMDIRPLQSSIGKNISFMQANLMKENLTLKNSYDSISCLHAIEHFGLGRYNDPISINGHIVGFNNLINMLKIGGKLYVSFPIGPKNQIQFNAQRVFHPADIFSWINDKNKVTLVRFDCIDDNQILHQNVTPFSAPIVQSGCGIYTFTKAN